MTRDEICSKFLESLPHALYPYQEEALLSWFSEGGGIMVCAPTGMGKTLLAVAALFEALHTRRRMYYTTPLIALTDQKFREMQDLAEQWGFSREDVGLITGNRKENPNAIVRVVVAEILLNHLLSGSTAADNFEQTDAVVMDEFHSFADPERGIVWELSLVLLPLRVRVMLLSATVGNPAEFSIWLQREHGRNITVITSSERRVPLDYAWVEDKLLTELLPEMVSADDAANRTPALIFCFNRDECWELAEQIKGLSVSNPAARAQIEALLDEYKDDLLEGVGPKLRQMLLRGVGVHHAGVLPKHKEIVEALFVKKLVPFVICTETLAAGINLPARSVVLTTLLKGKHGDKKVIPASTAHQIFGRAGRPQFDTKGYVYAVAHEDDARIIKWKRKYEQLDPKSKDLGIMKARKDMERKKPSRRKTEQYWMEGQFKSLIAAGPAKLFSKAMIPYGVLIFLLTRTGTLAETRAFLSRRFNIPERIAVFQEQLNFMIANLAGLGYLSRAEDGEHVTLDPSINRLLRFRSIDPLFGMFLCEQLVRSNFEEKLQALDAVLEMPPQLARRVALPNLPIGPLQEQVLQPQMIAMGVGMTPPVQMDDRFSEDFWDEEPQERPPTFPEMLKIAFEAKLANPEPVFVQPKWVGGGAFDCQSDFYLFVKSHDLVKQEGIILRHLLRLVILAGEFHKLTEDPDYLHIGELATRTCQRVDPTYVDRFLSEAAAARDAPL